MNNKYALIILLAISAALPVSAASPYNVRVWKASDGMGESNCRGVSTDRHGNVLTSHGPVRSLSYVTGYEVKSIPLDSNVGFPYSVLCDGHVWAYDTEQSIGVCDLSGGKWKSHRFDRILNDIQLPTFSPISSDSVILLSTDVVRRLDIDSNQVSVVHYATESAIAPFIHTIRSNGEGIWITGEGGVAKLEYPESDSSSKPILTEYPFEPGSGFKNFRFPKPGDEDSLFGTATIHDAPEALVYLDDGRWKILQQARGDIYGTGINENDYWFCSYLQDSLRGELKHCEQGTVSTVDHVSLYAYDFLAAGEDVLWAAGFYGLRRYSRHAWNVPEIMHLTGGFLGSINEDSKGRLWFMNSDYLIEHENGAWKLHELPEPEGWMFGYTYTQQLGSLPDGRMISAGTLPIKIFDPYSDKFELLPVPNECSSIYIHAQEDGNVYSMFMRSWRKKDYSLWKWEGDTFEPLLDLGGQWNIGEIRYLYEDSDGGLWFGGMSGQKLGLYKGGEYQTFGDRYPSDSAMSILELDNGKMWFSSRKDLVEYDGKDFYVIREGIEAISSMIQSKRDGSVWLASWDGLIRYHEGAWITYTEEDGLPSSKILEVFEDRQGTVWVGTTEGKIAYYDPGADRDPPKAILHPEENVAEISPGGEARFTYTGIDKWKYVRAERLLYSHRIDDGEWTTFSQDTIASYENLQPGPHRFQVRAMDVHLNISEKPAVYDFVVLTPWYKEPMFLILASIGTLLILLFAGLAYSRHRQVIHSNVQLHRTTNELKEANDELHTANERLLDLDKMKSSFVSQASHDLRTPLTAIKSSMDNLIRGIGGGLNEKQEKVLSRALRSVERLTHLINDVLDVNRIESGRMILEKSKVPFEKLVQDAINENRPAAEEKKITLQASGLDTSCSMELDAGKIERVVGELVSNAIKYTPEGGTVEIDLRKEDDSSLLSVKDSGIGMTPEECEKIFERFFRTKASQKMAKGSGLGLSIARELVEMHGGTLTVTSEEGRGTTFTMKLPREKELP